MSYMHISNLPKAQEIMLFKEAWALEKIHGTSAHVHWHKGEDILRPDTLTFFSGGASNLEFVQLFDQEVLRQRFMELGLNDVTVYGEAYGGKMHKMSETYGKKLKFIAFEVKVEESWLDVQSAFDVATKLGFEFVYFWKIKTDLASLDEARAQPSTQAFRNGCASSEDNSTWKMQEGIVLRPLIELRKNNGERIICKYKNEAFSERASKADTVVGDGDKIKVLADANAIADEWVTEMRLSHVLDGFEHAESADESAIPGIMALMYADVLRESKGEDPRIETKEVKRAISKKAAELFKQRLAAQRRVQLGAA